MTHKARFGPSGGALGVLVSSERLCRRRRLHALKCHVCGTPRSQRRRGSAFVLKAGRADPGQCDRPACCDSLRYNTPMDYTTLISVDDLAAQLTTRDRVVVDCRFSLGDTERGRRDYLETHVPGALYAHLDHDLSGSIVPGSTGRHPLPDIDALVRTLSAWGIDAEVQVIAYDDMGGVMAARLWWLLRWLGHQAVAVLDGGFPAWLAAQKPVSGGTEQQQPRRFSSRPRPDLVVTTEEVLAIVHDQSAILVDARDPERFRGEQEPIDPVAGRIPGALNAPHSRNLGADGLFLPADRLSARYKQLLGERDHSRCVLYCGSGVSAAHDLLAMAHAGLEDARLYAGSWSEWITDPNRPLETG